VKEDAMTWSHLVRVPALFTVAALWATPAAADEPKAGHRIAGTVLEVRGGAADVVVFLCDQLTGLPLDAATRRALDVSGRPDKLPAFLTAVSDQRGSFAFTDVPAGEYRVVAQKWTGPFKGVFEVHGSVIQLFGAADHVRVPSPEAEQVVLRPPGEGVLVLDQQVPNSATLLLLSTRPLAADPVLGLHALGRDFLTHLIGVNRMPYGRTVVVGMPREEVHAFFFAADNNPGYAAASYEVPGYERAAKVPFVASWSDGRHDPPPRLREVQELLRRHGMTAFAAVGLTPTGDGAKDRAAFRKLADDFGRHVKLPGGESATVGELLAAEAYTRLEAAVRQRKR
jgi:hypothetical protein